MAARVTNRVLIAALFVFSFSGQAAEQNVPTITTLSGVDKCRFINTVSTSSGFGKQINLRQHLEHKILSKAKDVGATHVVIVDISLVGAFNGTMDANTYVCSS